MMSRRRNEPLFMILPTELQHLEDQYKSLWVAVHDFDRPAFKHLVDSLPLAKARDSANNSVLHFAAAVGNPDCLAYVLSKPGDRPPFDAVNFASYTALQMALMNIAVSRPDHKLREVVRLLLEAGDDPRLPHGLDNALVSAAAVKCPVTIHRIYLSVVHREPNKRHLMKMLRNADWSITHFIWTKDLELLRHLIDYDKSVLTCSKFSRITPLHRAVEARAPVDVFRLLLSYNLDPNVTTTQELNTPLHRVCELAGDWDNLDVVEKLLSAGADPNVLNRHGRNCLHMAAKSGSDPVVRAVLKHHVELHAWDLSGKTAMHWAAISGSVPVITTLHEIGLSMEKCRDTGATPLHLASRYCRPEAVAHLISLGLDVNGKDNRNRTPLHYAVKKQASNLDRRCTETVDTLVDHGGELFNESNGSTSILRYCINNNYLHNASIVIRHLALNESKGPKANEYFMNMIESDVVLKEAYDSCIAELKLMKETVVYGWVTMYKMLTGTDKMLKGLMRNPEFVIKMNACIINRMIYFEFPIYCTRIINRYTAMEKEQRRIKNASQSLSHLIDHAIPSDEIVNTIVKYLDPADIDRLVQYRHEMTAESFLNFRKKLSITHTLRTCLY